MCGEIDRMEVEVTWFYMLHGLMTSESPSRIEGLYHAYVCVGMPSCMVSDRSFHNGITIIDECTVFPNFASGT